MNSKRMRNMVKLIVMLCIAVFMITGCDATDGQKNSPSDMNLAYEEQLERNDESAEEVTAEPEIAQTSEPTPAATPEPTPEATPEPTPVVTPDPVPVVTAEPTEVPAPVVENETSDETVYVGKTGTKYHDKSCRTLKNGAYPMSLSEALEEGREACKVCGG